MDESRPHSDGRWWRDYRVSTGPASTGRVRTGRVSTGAVDGGDGVSPGIAITPFAAGEGGRSQASTGNDVHYAGRTAARGVSVGRKRAGGGSTAANGTEREEESEEEGIGDVWVTAKCPAPVVVCIAVG